MRVDTSPLVGVVVVNYGSHALVESNVLAMDAGGATVIVVDSFSSDEERRAVQTICDRHDWQFEPTDHNLGFGAAANLGATRAIELGVSTIAFVNPDLSISASELTQLATIAASRPFSALSPKIDRPDGSPWFAGAVVDRRTGLPGRRPPQHASIPWLSGACLVMSVDLWRKVGGFDPDYFMYWEDVDLSYRCTDAGGELRVVSDVLAIHDVGATQGAGKSLLYVRSCCRNRLLFAGKHLSRREILVWIACTPVASWRIARRGRGGKVLARSPRVLAAMCAGSTAGCWHAARGLLRTAGTSTHVEDRTGDR